MNEHCYSTVDVYNADEPGVSWRSISETSVASRRESFVPCFEISKDGTTVTM